MPLELIESQPYFTDLSRPANWDCLDDPQYCHKVAPGDTVNIQFYQTPCNDNEIDDPNFNDTTQGAQILLEPDFTTVVNWIFIGTSWTHGSGKVTHVVGNTDSVVQATALAAGWYKLNITITDMTAGGVYVSISTGDAGSSANIIEDGTYTIYLYYVAGAQISIIPTTDFDGAVDQCDLYTYSWNDWTILPPAIPSDNRTICKIDNTAIATITNIQGGSVWITAGEYYEVQLTITNYGSGTLNIDCSDIPSKSFSGNGTFTFWATPTINGTLVINLSSDFTGCIGVPTVYALRNDYTVDLNGLSGEISLPSTYITYFERFVNVAFDPEDAALPFPECFTIQLVDQCDQQFGEFAINGNFAGGSGVSCPNWFNNNAGTQYDYTGEVIKLSFNATLFANSAIPFANNTQQTQFIDTVGEITNYRITFDIDAKNALAGDGVNDKLVGDLNDIQMGVRIYGQTTPLTWFTAVAVDNTYDVALPADYGTVIDNPNALRLQFFARFDALGDPLPSRGNITGNNLRVEKLAPYKATFETECMKYDSHPNTVLIQATCDANDALGFNFESGHVISQRIGCRTQAIDFELNESRYTFSDGDSDKYYSDRAKFWQMFIDMAPHSVHDALATQIQCSNVLIGNEKTTGESYIIDSEYVPEFDKSNASDLAQGRLRLKKSNKNTAYNRNC